MRGPELVQLKRKALKFAFGKNSLREENGERSDFKTLEIEKNASKHVKKNHWIKAKPYVF